VQFLLVGIKILQYDAPMKRIRLNHEDIISNCAALVEQLTTQMPSSELTDTDKAFFAHVLGLQALLVKLGYLNAEVKTLIRLLSYKIGLDDAERTLELTLPPMGAVLDKTNQKLCEILQQVNQVRFGGVNILHHKATPQAQQKVYAYVLFRHNHRGFQHYSRRLELLVPAGLEETLLEAARLHASQAKEQATTLA